MRAEIWVHMDSLQAEKVSYEELLTKLQQVNTELTSEKLSKELALERQKCDAALLQLKEEVTWELRGFASQMGEVGPASRQYRKEYM